ncbi:RNA-directed DNA polymerase, eukaryota [Tanacetum coccineum]
MRLIQSLVSKELVRNLPKLKFNQHFCDACKIRKQAHASHKAKNIVSTTRCLELLHMDLFGPSVVQSYGGNRYTLVIVDGYSRSLIQVESKKKEGVEDCHYDDPFKIYDLLNKKKVISNGVEHSDGNLKYPPRFTPMNATKVNSNSVDKDSREEKECDQNCYKNEEVSVTKKKRSSSILEEDRDVGHAMGYKMKGCVKNIEEVIKLEEKMKFTNEFFIFECSSPSVGNLGGIICVWDSRMFHKRNHTISYYFVDVKDKGETDSSLLAKRIDVMKLLQDLEKIDSLEVAQKAKIKWSIEVDENSKYFHGILNKKRSQLAIRGILVDGSWIDSPNKSLGPNGFTFGFYRRYWSVIEKDVVEAVSYFFRYGTLYRGGNSSFIALILKMQDAKMVKDFRPISLIGSLYKIIAKTMANRLLVVLGDIVNEVKSTFVSNRQILDGPFILNELIQWCKARKKQTMILKVDFEKAYDSVRWDYLEEVLKKFGFGDKWRVWIKSCLSSSRGSILVNGSATKEFQFYKGLKQGDPLSPFLFLLIMESLYLSFQQVVNEGLFNGVSIGSSLHVSYLFYADDVVFMRQ